MAGAQLAALLAKRERWETALEAIALRGETYSVGNRSLTSAQIPLIQGEITRLTRKINHIRAVDAGSRNPIASLGNFRR